MVMDKNPDYQGQDYPYDGILVPPSLNEGKPIKKILLAADAAGDIAFGNVVYISAGTQKNDATCCTAEYGKDDREGSIYLACPFSRSGPLTFPYTTDAPSTPYLIPNTSITKSTYELAAEEEFTGIKLVEGMKFWGLIGNAITSDVVVDYIYYCITDYIGAQGDPDGTAIAKKGHAFKAIASFTNLNWALFEYMGSQTYDDSA